MQELFLRRLGLLAANDELATFDRDVQFIAAKACDSERNAQLLFFGLFDVVGRIAVCGGLGSPLEQTLEVLETEQKRAVEIDGSVHIKALLQAALGTRWPRKRRPVWRRQPRQGRHLLLVKNVGCGCAKSRSGKALI
jgi:hypothetical protein